MKEPSFEKPAPREKVPAELEEQKREAPMTQEEIDRGKAEFDTTLGETLAGGQERLAPEELEKIQGQADKLNPPEKARFMEDLRKEEQLPEGERNKREEEARKYQESVAKYEEAIDNVAERASALGIEIPRDQLRGYLERFKSVRPEEGEEEGMEWLKYFEERFGKVEAEIQNLERAKERGELTPERKKEAEETLGKTFEDLIAKMIEYAAKLAYRIIKGILIGVIRAMRKG